MGPRTIVWYKHSGNLFLLVEPDLEFGSFSQHSYCCCTMGVCIRETESLPLADIEFTFSKASECSCESTKCLYILLLLFWYSLYISSSSFFIPGCCKDDQWISRYDKSECMCVCVCVCAWTCVCSVSIQSDCLHSRFGIKLGTSGNVSHRIPSQHVKPQPPRSNDILFLL